MRLRSHTHTLSLAFALSIMMAGCAGMLDDRRVQLERQIHELETWGLDDERLEDYRALLRNIDFAQNYGPAQKVDVLLDAGLARVTEDLAVVPGERAAEVDRRIAHDRSHLRGELERGIPQPIAEQGIDAIRDLVAEREEISLRSGRRVAAQSYDTVLTELEALIPESSARYAERKREERERALERSVRLQREGDAARRRGELDAALQAYRSALDAHPDDASREASLGETIREVEAEMNRATRRARAAARRTEARNRLWEGLGALRRGSYDDAARHFEAAVELDPGLSEEALRMRVEHELESAHALILGGGSEAAVRAHYDRAQALDPSRGAEIRDSELAAREEDERNELARAQAAQREAEAERNAREEQKAREQAAVEAKRRSRADQIAACVAAPLRQGAVEEWCLELGRVRNRCGMDVDAAWIQLCRSEGRDRFNCDAEATSEAWFVRDLNCLSILSYGIDGANRDQGDEVEVLALRTRVETTDALRTELTGEGSLYIEGAIRNHATRPTRMVRLRFNVKPPARREMRTMADVVERVWSGYSCRLEFEDPIEPGETQTFNRYCGPQTGNVSLSETVFRFR